MPDGACFPKVRFRIIAGGGAEFDNGCAVSQLSTWNHGYSTIIIIDADLGRA
jgi:hypothetical protein